MSFPIPEKARARGGAAIEPTWEALQDWSDTIQPTFHGKHVRVRELPGETHFSVLRPRARPLYFFRVGISGGTRAVIGKGWINVRMPTVKDVSGDPYYLDGRTLDGIATGRPVALECLEGDDGGPGPDGLSYVCVRIVVDPETGIPLEKDLGPEFLSVVHRPELPEGFFSGGMPEEVIENEDGSVHSGGLWPLAILTWGDRRIVQFDQYTLHNLKHRFTPSEDGEGPARHWFFGAT